MSLLCLQKADLLCSPEPRECPLLTQKSKILKLQDMHLS
jgi:hypothetical protein